MNAKALKTAAEQAAVRAHNRKAEAEQAMRDAAKRRRAASKSRK
jgi:hypothetical protein